MPPLVTAGLSVAAIRTYSKRRKTGTLWSKAVAKFNEMGFA
jgi:hypothetical protein